MNDFVEIDLRSWKRRPKFEYYRTFQNQLVNLTVELDASALHHCAKSRGVSFFLLTLYAVLRAVDSVPQLRQRILSDGRVIEFRHTAVLTPVMADDEEFVMALAEYAGTFDEFRKQAEPAVAAAKRGVFDPEVRKRNDFFCASCVPWFSFQSLSQAALTTDQSIVILAWGRLKEDKKLPVAIQANHSLVDGIHFSHFYQTLGDFFKAPGSLFA